MQPRLKLPIGPTVAFMSALCIAELFLLPQASPIPAVIAVHVVVLGTFALIPRAPALILGLFLLELFIVKELRINEMISVTIALLTSFAVFAAAALAPTKRVPLIAALLVAHLGWRASLGTDTGTLLLNAALLATATATGAILHRRHRRLTQVLAERDLLIEALASGPADASTAEQLRMWSEVEQRIEPVIAALPGLVQQAARAPADETAERLERVREEAADALAVMQATVRTLGDPEHAAPAAPETTTLDRLAQILATHGPVERRGDTTFRASRYAAEDPRLALLAGRVRALGGRLRITRRRGATEVRVAFDTPRQRRRRTISPLWIASLVLLAGAIHELVALDGPAQWTLLAYPLIPLLALRAPLTAATALGAITIAICATGAVSIYSTTPDLTADLTLLVLGAFATRRRAVAGLLIIQAGMHIAMAADAHPWPTVSYIAAAFVMLGHWIMGALLRGVAAEQWQVGTSLGDAVEALDALEARAVRRERVRLAHELHDLVGHALTALAIQAAAARAQLKTGRVPAFDQLAAAAHQGATELQRLATVLGHDTDIAAELARVTDTARATGQHVELDLEEPVTELDPHVRHTVICVAAEALTNAAKHAAGAAVRVRLEATGDRLELAVVDDGGHARDLPSGGRGMDSMAQRVRACGGTFTSGPRPGGGWTVQAVLPLSV